MLNASKGSNIHGGSGRLLVGSGIHKLSRIENHAES